MCAKVPFSVHLKEGTSNYQNSCRGSGPARKEHTAASPEHLSLCLSPKEMTWFLECGFILHPMADAVIRAVSTIKAWKWEQRPPLPGNSWAMPRSFSGAGPVAGFDFFFIHKMPKKAPRRVGGE